MKNDVLFYKTAENIVIRRDKKFAFCEVIGDCYKEIKLFNSLRAALMNCKVEVAR